MEYKELIGLFAEKHGVEDLTIEDGGVTFVIDFTAVTIREAVNARAIIVSEIGRAHV